MYQIESRADAPEVNQLLEEKIYEHNSATTRRNDGHLFSKLIRDETGNIIAGIAGWTWAGACEITQLWVDKKIRGKGAGQILLAAAEREARSRECHTIVVKTYSFQAPGFYRKHGYQIAHTLDSFPVGYAYYTLLKKLPE